MSKRTVFILLAGLNLILLMALMVEMRRRAVSTKIDPTPASLSSAKADPPAKQSAASPGPPTNTPWPQIYATDLKRFVANLRRVNCPEETVKDIVVAEINRRFATREAGLRPTPGDHVPLGWGGNLTEVKLQERRRDARSLAREKAALLLDTLGYEVAVDLPAYATFGGDSRFETALALLPSEKHAALRDVNASYWKGAEELEARTKGFWQAEDMAELTQLKKEHRDKVDKLLTEDEWVTYMLNADKYAIGLKNSSRGLDVTEEETRAMLKANHQVAGATDLNGKLAVLEQPVIDNLRTNLGEERANEIIRLTQDTDYASFYRATRQAGASPDVIRSANEMRLTLQQQINGLAENTNWQDAAQRNALLKAAREASQKISDMLGVQASQALGARGQNFFRIPIPATARLIQGPPK